MLALMALRQVLTLLTADRPPDLATPSTELPGLVVSVMAFLALLFLERLLTERKLAEEALRRNQDAIEQALRDSEARFAVAFRAAPDPIIISSFPEGRLIELNDGFTRLTGYDREEAVGRTTQELDLWAHPAQRQRMLETLKDQGRFRDSETAVRLKSGEVRPCLFSGEIVELEGKPCLVSVVRDVTADKRAEEEREAFVRELELKNSELERFTYTVSHDLKSPLITIRGFLGLLERDAAAGDSERMARDAAKIKAATESMQRLLDELLQLSRIGRLVNPPEEVELAELAREAVDQVAGQIAERGVEVEIAPDLPAVLGDRSRLLEVWQNLIDNAIKFMGDQPEPRVEVGKRQDRETGEVVFYVRDNGMGIDPSYHQIIFGLFERLDQQIAGTGIGLALVQRIVEVHGGRIWVESEGQGHGSTFCLTLHALPNQLEKSSK